MYSFSDFLKLDEHVINIGFDPSQEHNREKHRQEIHDMLRSSYRHIGYGGHEPSSDKESHAIHDDISHAAIKATKRNGKISSVILYKRSHGRKQIAGGTDGTISGKKDWFKIAHDDHVNPKTAHKRNAWIEASGGPMEMMKKMGATEIPVKRMKHLLPGKDIEDAPEKGKNAYRRTVGGAKHTKTGYGRPLD